MTAAPLLEFMLERHRIYELRAHGMPWPWTLDPILQAYRFCNVYRELDAVTIWIRENIREPFAGHPNLWFMLCIARQINWPSTLQALLDDRRAWPRGKTWAWERARQVMLDIQARGEKLYTGAYMLNAHGTAPDDPQDKAFFTCRLVLDSVWRARARVIPALHQKSLEVATNALQPYHGWGPFTAYEVACDLRYTQYLQDARDTLTWANPGPGAARGLNRLAGRPVADRVPRAQAIAEMQQLLGQVQRRWPAAWPTLELREIEHSLCEYDKYERVRLGQGRPRAKFHFTGV